MPQMMPINWISLFLLFLMIFFLFNSFNYFSFLYNNKNLMHSKKKSQFNWKW